MSEVQNRDEFVAEAQEELDALNRDLLVAERAVRAGREVVPELINMMFRSAHSLKGVAGMFGIDAVTQLAHALEGVLDGMRLGRLALRAPAFDDLFACVERLQAVISTAVAGGGQDDAALAAMVARLAKLAAGDDASATPDLAHCGLTPEALAVLTEYEEHRLGETLRRGRGLYLLKMSFDITSFDVGLAELDQVLRGQAEIIAKLPSSQEGDANVIAFDIVVGSALPLAALRALVADAGAEVQELTAPSPQAAAGRATAAAGGAPSAAPSAPALEPAAAADVNAAASIKSVAQTVRVDIHRLDHLMHLVGELGLTRAAIARLGDALRDAGPSAGFAGELEREGRSFERRLAELQAGIMEVRMVPLVSLFERLVRMARRMGRELGREVRVEMVGAHTELDKLLVEDLADPLMHLIRNAIDHGIEAPDVRRQRGKPAEGQVRLEARAQGSHVVVAIADDGGGIDVARVTEAAVARGLLPAARAAELSRREAYGLLFMPGFSTRAEATAYSGRGVGLDVVKTNIAALAGAVDIDSNPGAGTTFTVTVPITLAIIGALIVEVAGNTYAVPLNSVLETVTLAPGDVHVVGHNEVVSLRGATVPLADLRQIFALGGSPRPAHAFGIVVGLGQGRLVVAVDALVGQQEIVIKSLGRRIRHVRGLAGATELAGSHPVLVIDTLALLAEAHRDEMPMREAG